MYLFSDDFYLCNHITINWATVCLTTNQEVAYWIPEISTILKVIVSETKSSQPFEINRVATCLRSSG